MPPAPGASAAGAAALELVEAGAAEELLLPLLLLLLCDVLDSAVVDVDVEDVVVTAPDVLVLVLVLVLDALPELDEPDDSVDEPDDSVDETDEPDSRVALEPACGHSVSLGQKQSRRCALPRQRQPTGKVVVRLVSVLPAELVVVTARPVMVLPAESVVTTAPEGWLAPELAPELAPSDGPESVLVRLVKVLPAELVIGPVTPTMVLPDASVVVTASLVPVVCTLPAESTEMTGAPGIPLLATPRRALMAASSETKLG